MTAFVNSLELDPQSLIECDIAIIGAGMAGICLARELADTGVSVCLLESGGEQAEKRTSALNQGVANLHSASGKVKSIDPYLVESRERYFGGTGNAWGGKCAHFDVHDFVERSWIPGSGWPFEFSDIKPYYDRACYRLRIPTLDGIDAAASRPQTVLNSQRNFTTSLRCFTGLTGEPMSDAFHDYKYGLKNFPNIRVYLYANVEKLQVNPEGTHVQAAHIKCLNQQRHVVRAKHFILASGGIENVRILLNSNDHYPNGIGNQYDLLGRFFSGHGKFQFLNGLSNPPASLRLHESDKNIKLYCDPDPTQVQGVFGLTYKAQWRERVAQFTASLTAENADRQLGVFFMIEQFPNADSRICLSPTKDVLGIPQVRLDWHFCESDTETLSRGARLFARDVLKNNWGELQDAELNADITEVVESSRHHMGCTRMHADPKRGVVDENTGVHGMQNLFVAGSSVFPTGGVANPTLTILALAIRLADHLKNNIQV